ncbi:MAG: hypothetical protein A2Y10_19885 [Planctomycetes bacterium GWF2_41_51]|nr:MAG: hypothetical protein A2Y10_19885 [Planctomycetes bacterium GWF2_41_51]HBG28546.1 hypothetical protein [Phycisphaerales bacterium]
MVEKKGFTLVELLVVISIIAILLAVLMPALSKARNQAKMVICATNMRSILNAVNLWMADNGNNRYPPSTQGFAKSITKRTEAGWWTVPCRLKYYYGTPKSLNGGSVIEVLGSYMKSAKYFNCPLVNNNVEWEDEFLEMYSSQRVMFLDSSYMYLWNYRNFIENEEANPTKPYIGKGFNPTYGNDTLMLTDFFMAGEQYNIAKYGNNLWMSAHPLPKGRLNDFLGTEAFTEPFDQKIKLYMTNSTQIPSVYINNGYLDGHIQKFNVRNDCEQIMLNDNGTVRGERYYLPRKWR